MATSDNDIELVNTNPRKINETKPSPFESVTTSSNQAGGAIWGRTGGGRSWLGSLAASSPIILGPLTTITTYIVLTTFSGSFWSFFTAVAKEGFWSICLKYGPQLTLKGVLAIAGWTGLQALLFHILPGEIRTGQYTPAGHLLKYRMNGLYAWILTHALYFVVCWIGLLDPAFIPRNWSGLVAAGNLAGLLISAFAFVKAYVSPTHADDRKFSGTFDIFAKSCRSL